MNVGGIELVHDAAGIHRADGRPIAVPFLDPNSYTLTDPANWSDTIFQLKMGNAAVLVPELRPYAQQIIDYNDGIAATENYDGDFLASGKWVPAAILALAGAGAAGLLDAAPAVLAEEAAGLGVGEVAALQPENLTMWDELGFGGDYFSDSGYFPQDAYTAGIYGDTLLPGEVAGIPADAPYTGGDWLGQLGNAVVSRVASEIRGNALPGGAPMYQQAAFPALGALGGALGLGAAGAAVGRALPAIGGAVARAGRGLMVNIGGVMRRIASKDAVALAKRVGLDAAAVALGVSSVQLAGMVIADQKRGRRGAGITASAMRTTRKTIRKFNSLHRQISSMCRPTVHHKRKC